jgi:hypothetical protein
MGKHGKTIDFSSEPEVASKIQARARERGVSVDVYLQELIDQKETDSERSKWLSSQERVRMLREWASGHRGERPMKQVPYCADGLSKS